jgi:hypothetical protein
VDARHKAGHDEHGDTRHTCPHWPVVLCVRGGGNYPQNNFEKSVCAAEPNSSYLGVPASSRPETTRTERSVTMRFMVIVKASKDTEAGVMPSTELLAAMGKFNEEMAKAGVIEAGEGLHPTSKGARVKYAGAQPAVSRGPFSLTGDLVTGFWLIKTNSLDEAIDWMKRAPFDRGAEIEIRQVVSAEDFGEALTPELREQEERLRAQVGKK